MTHKTIEILSSSSCNLIKDFKKFLIDYKEIEDKKYSDYFSHFFSSRRDGYTAADYEKWWQQQYGDDDSSYNSDWSEYDEYTDGIIPYRKGKQSTNKKGKKRRGKKHNKKKGDIFCNSTKYINGRLVSDSEWEEYQESKGRKHTKINDALEMNDLSSERVVKFYNTLGDENDCEEFYNLHEFDEWCTENKINLSEDMIDMLLWNGEIHCCLDPRVIDKNILFCSRSYGDLVFDLCGGDMELLEYYSRVVNRL